MIAGNARLMAEIPELIQEPLTPDLIRRFHAIGMGGINDEKYSPGEFRDTDDVVIADYDGNIVHQPPAATDLQARLQMVCDFVNDTESYVHPLAKACVLHFMLVHEHPFRDGNGRTSRGLFTGTCSNQSTTYLNMSLSASYCMPPRPNMPTVTSTLKPMVWI